MTYTSQGYCTPADLADLRDLYDLNHREDDDMDDADDADDAGYIDDLVSLVESFRYERCAECGQDANRHVFSPDPLGKPHAWCTTEPDDGEEA